MDSASVLWSILGFYVGSTVGRSVVMVQNMTSEQHTRPHDIVSRVMSSMLGPQCAQICDMRALRVSRRGFSRQSHTKYTWWGQERRFTPLPDIKHCAWVVSQLACRRQPELRARGWSGASVSDILARCPQTVVPREGVYDTCEFGFLQP